MVSSQSDINVFFEKASFHRTCFGELTFSSRMQFTFSKIVILLVLPIRGDSQDGNRGNFLLDRVLEDVSSSINQTLAEGFCKNMSAFEEYLTNSFTEYFEVEENADLGDGYKCNCTEADPSLEIECTLTHKMSPQATQFETTTEIVYFQKTNGAYELVRTEVLDSVTNSDTNSAGPSTSFTFDGGQATGCEGPGGCPCSVCDDHESFALDCGLFYSTYCNETYSGAFSNRYDFGTIAAAEPPSGAIPHLSTVSCLSMSIAAVSLAMIAIGM
eukprot:scaffold248_cov111-Cylindrotheca_fusiformis.AAC.6